jgi:hypothetical protein
MNNNYYRNTPGGCGNINPNLRGKMIPIELEDILSTGSRAHRRWAEKEMRKMARAKVRELRKGGES